jgi:CheY-like chemotaxis protein
MLADLKARFLPEFIAETRTRLRTALSLIPPAGPGGVDSAQQIAAMMHSITGETMLIGAPDLTLLARAAGGAARRFVETGSDKAMVVCARTLRSFARAVEDLALRTTAVPIPPGPTDSSSKERIRILVVDDSPLNAALLREVLANDGFDTHAVGDDMELILQKLESLRPRFLLVDWIMPGCDTRLLCQRIRGTPSLAQLRVLLITSLPEAEAAEQARALEVDGALSKELGMLAIVDRVRALAAERQ